MGGGLMQLVAYGPQDIYLTGNPQVTFFKVVYRRHTNFAMESIQTNFNGGTPDFGNTVTATIPRNGDLVKDLHLELDLPALTGSGTQAWIHNIGTQLIDKVTCHIGGQEIVKLYGQFMYIWNEITQSAALEDTYNVMVGNTTVLTTEAASIAGTHLHVKLPFWFCRNIGLALPLIALQYHEVKIDITFRPFSQCHVSTSGVVNVPVLQNAVLWVDYVFLDTDERRNFAQIAHEYLIEQVQFTGRESFSQVNVQQRLNFNHPCKMLVTVAQLASNVESVGTAGALANRWTDFGDGTTPHAGNDHLVDMKLQLNGNDRFATRPASYFNLVQPSQYLPRGPAVGIYVYSFAVKPTEHQPSGSVNMSRIDNATLQLTMASSAAFNLYTYMISYNILRVMSGMAGLAYSN
jgi:hypothetical protein